MTSPTNSRRSFLAAIAALAATTAPARAVALPPSEIAHLVERHWTARAAAERGRSGRGCGRRAVRRFRGHSRHPGGNVQPRGELPVRDLALLLDRRLEPRQLFV